MIGHDRNGSVLIIVLLVLAAAAYLIMESGKYLRIDYEGAAFQRTMVSGGELLRSGMVVAQELLTEDRKKGGNSDHKFEDWAEVDTFFTEISSQLESGEMEGVITADNGMIPLNLLSQSTSIGKALGEIFVRVVDGLQSAHGIEGNAKDFLASIEFWLAVGKDTQGDAAWYGAQQPAYVRRKGKMQSPQELLLVHWKGVSPEDRRKLILGADGVPGLIDFVTVWSAQKINVNFAPREVVAAMCPDSALRQEFTERIMEYRDAAENLFDAGWYVTVARSVGVDKLPSVALGWRVLFSGFC